MEKIMGEFHEVASEIARRLREPGNSKGIAPGELPRIVSDIIGHRPINCYPGIPSDRCFDLAFFISLTSPVYTGGRRGHYSCRQAIEKVVQHMQGLCVNETKHAILLTDSWDALAYNEWREFLLKINKVTIFDIYLMVGPKASKINI